MPYCSKGDSSFVEYCKICLSEHFSLLFDAFGVCRLLCKAIKKKAPYYCKEDKSSKLMEGLFSRTFFACFALRLVCSLHFKANERQLPYYCKGDSSFVEY